MSSPFFPGPENGALRAFLVLGVHISFKGARLNGFVITIGAVNDFPRERGIEGVVEVPDPLDIGPPEIFQKVFFPLPDVDYFVFRRSDRRSTPSEMFSFIFVLSLMFRSCFPPILSPLQLFPEILPSFFSAFFHHLLYPPLPMCFNFVLLFFLISTNPDLFPLPTVGKQRTSSPNPLLVIRKFLCDSSGGHWTPIPEFRFLSPFFFFDLGDHPFSPSIFWTNLLSSHRFPLLPYDIPLISVGFFYSTLLSGLPPVEKAEFPFSLFPGFPLPFFPTRFSTLFFL